MMRKIYTLLLLLSSVHLFGQVAEDGKNGIKRPKIVVGIVVDQMRWDYLYRYYDRFSSGGFKRLLNKGFSCEQAYINYLPSTTAVGHSSIFTGSVPAIHGITGNGWPDQATGKDMYCTADSTVHGIGTTGSAGKMSPRNLLATTITDELRMATNFRSKVVGISLKDRASILPAGHNANAAFWADEQTGQFISSSWYMDDLPQWVKDYNAAGFRNQLMQQGWNTLYPIATYMQSTADDVVWEGVFRKEPKPVFPHDINTFAKDNASLIRTTPFGNTLTLDFAKAAIKGYGLGESGFTDFLTINCASTDYVGHQYGPNSIEIEDTFLRLDRDLASFFTFLDEKMGKDNYLIFLTADHGGSHSVDYLETNKMPGDLVNSKANLAQVNAELAKFYNLPNLVLSMSNYHVTFNQILIEKQKLDFELIKKRSAQFLRTRPGIQFVVDVNELGTIAVPEKLKDMIANGYNAKRSGPLVIIPEPGWFDGSNKGTTHGNWNADDTHIPLLFYGWGLKPGALKRSVSMTDIAPTIAALLHIQVPSGTVGKAIEEVGVK